MPEFLPLHDRAGEEVARLYDRLTLKRGLKLNPGQALMKLGPRPDALKTITASYFESWKEIAEAPAPASREEQKNAHLRSIAASLICRRNGTLAIAGLNPRQFQAEVVWRMVIGMATPNPLETSLTLHPQYGIPLIPGSSLKGITRAWCLLSLADSIGIYPLPYDLYRERRKKRKITHLEQLEVLLVAPDKSEEQQAARAQAFAELQNDVKEVVEVAAKDIPANEQPPLPKVTGMTLNKVFDETKAKYFLPVFGEEATQGKVNFLDALPIYWKYRVDVMTPHYGDYYMSKPTQVTPPADWLEPTPIPFLAIDKGTRFDFALTGSDAALVEMAESWLKEAIQELGVGGKTLTGYGEMQEVRAVS